MKLLYMNYGIILPLQENHTHWLCIETANAYAEIVQSLYNQCSGGEGHALLSDEFHSFSLNKTAEIILEPFSLSFHSKKIQAQLYKELGLVVDEYHHADFLHIQMELHQFAEIAMQYLPYPIDYDDMVDMGKLFKLLNLHIDYSYESLAEKLCGYITLLSQLCGVQVVFLVDCDKYLTKEESEVLQKTANYYKVYLIHIVSSLRNSMDETDIYCILDQDYCILTNDYD